MDSTTPSRLHPETYRRLVEAARELADIPGTQPAEISLEGLIVMMTPSNPHELIVRRVVRQFDRQLDPDSSGVSAGSADIEDPSLGVLRRPDVAVLPEQQLVSGESVDPRFVLVVVEVVSRSNPDNDYTGKVRDYAAMGIPWYVILDPRNGTGELLSEVGPGADGPRYTTRHEFLFGETVKVDGWTLDTTGFPTY